MAGKNYKPKLQVVVLSSRNYLKHVIVLVASIRKNAPDLGIILHLINVPESAEEIQLIKKLDPQVKLRYEQGIGEDAKCPAYCTIRRARVLYEELTDQQPFLLYLDADSIIRRPLDKIMQILDCSDVVMFHRPERDLHMRFAAGVIGIRHSRASCDLLRKWMEKLESKTPEWFDDQRFLWDAFSEVGESLKFEQLPKEYIDWKFQTNTYIWVGKGKRKFENKLYTMEEAYYEKWARGESTAMLSFLSFGFRLARIPFKAIKSAVNLFKKS